MYKPPNTLKLDIQFGLVYKIGLWAFYVEKFQLLMCSNAETRD